MQTSFLQCSKFLQKKRIFDVVIIGGGHNGLVCAYYLAKTGKSVCVLERRELLGGAAVTEEVVSGFRFSRASYVLGLLRPQIMKDMELQKHGLKVYSRDPGSYTPLKEKYWKGESGPKSLTLGLDAAKNITEIAKFSKNDAEMFPKYEAYLRKFVTGIQSLLDVPPPNMTKFSSSNILGKLKHLQEFYPLFKTARNFGPDLPRFFKFLTSPSQSLLNEFFESEPLKATLATDSVIGTMASPLTPGTGYVLLHHMMGQTNEVEGAWGFPEGGMGAVTEAMAKAAHAAGAHLFVNQPVNEILVDRKSKSVVGVQTGDLTVEAKTVISNATPSVTFLKLLQEKFLPPEFLHEVKSVDFSSPVCKINVALSRLPNFSADSKPGVLQPLHQCTIHLNCEEVDFIDEAFCQAKLGDVPDKPLIEMTIPSSRDPTLAPNGAHVALLFTQYVPNGLCEEGLQSCNSLSNEIREKYVEKVFSCIEDYSPGFRSSIVGYEVLMPSDLEQIFGLTGGNIFHGAISPHQLFTSRPTVSHPGPTTPLGGLFMCGAGMHPGGGVMGAPGYIAAKAVLERSSQK